MPYLSIVYRIINASDYNILSTTQTAVILAIKSTQSLIDKTQLALASGKKISSALDNPQSFFTASGLSDQASDLMKLLDGISINIQRVNETNNGIQAILKLLDQAESLLSDARSTLFQSSSTIGLGNNDIQAILAANPGVFYSAASNSFYKPVVSTVSWTTADAAAKSATLTIPPSVTDVTNGVGGHLANVTSQAENNFIKSILTVNSWLGGSDNANEGQWIWTSGPEAGQQFWQGNIAGSPINGSYTDWAANGQPDNSGGNENYLEMWLAQDGWNDFVDNNPGGHTPGYVVEWDSSLLSPTNANLSAQAAQYRTQYLGIMDQIDKIAKDSHYLGIDLLLSNNLKTLFNPTGTSFLLTKGTDATSAGLGLVDLDFLSSRIVDSGEQNVRDAKDILRTYARSLQSDLSVISTRLDFTKSSININQTAADGLVDADQNQEGAQILALNVRQQLQFQVLALTKSNIANLLSK